MRRRKETNRVVFHHSLTYGGSVDTFREWHKARGWEDIGYHYVIHENGLVEKGRDLDLVGSHARGKNGDSVGVCYIGNFHKKEPEKIALEYGALLYVELCEIYNKSLIIDWHRKSPSYDVKTGKRNDCPGPLFDRQKFIDLCIDRCWKLGVNYV